MSGHWLRSVVKRRRRARRVMRGLVVGGAGVWTRSCSALTVMVVEKVCDGCFCAGLRLRMGRGVRDGAEGMEGAV